MSEYQIKLKIITGNLLPPYSVEGVEIYEANSGKEAVEKAKAEYRQLTVGIDAPPLQVLEVAKL